MPNEERVNIYFKRMDRKCAFENRDLPAGTVKSGFEAALFTEASGRHCSQICVFNPCSNDRKYSKMFSFFVFGGLKIIRIQMILMERENFCAGNEK